MKLLGFILLSAAAPWDLYAASYKLIYQKMYKKTRGKIQKAQCGKRAPPRKKRRSIFDLPETGRVYTAEVRMPQNFSVFFLKRISTAIS